MDRKPFAPDAKIDTALSLPLEEQLDLRRAWRRCSGAKQARVGSSQGARADVRTRWPSPADSADVRWFETESGGRARARSTRAERMTLESVYLQTIFKIVVPCSTNELSPKNQRIGFEPTTQDVVCNRASAHLGTRHPNAPGERQSTPQARRAVPYDECFVGVEPTVSRAGIEPASERHTSPGFTRSMTFATPQKRRKPPG